MSNRIRKWIDDACDWVLDFRSTKDEDGMDTESDGVLPLKGFVRLWKEHPAVVLSMAFAYVSGLGLFYSYAYYWSFGINIFDFQELNDFFMVAIRNPFSILGMALLILFSLLFDDIVSAVIRKIRSWLEIREKSEDDHFGFGRFSLIVTNRIIHGVLSRGLWTFIVLYAPFSLMMSAGFSEGNAAKFFSPSCKVYLIDNSEKSGQQYRMLGSTGGFVFLYNTKSARVETVNKSNLSEIVWVGNTVQLVEDSIPTQRELIQ